MKQTFHLKIHNSYYVICSPFTKKIKPYKLIIKREWANFKIYVFHSEEVIRQQNLHGCNAFLKKTLLLNNKLIVGIVGPIEYMNTFWMGRSFGSKEYTKETDNTCNSLDLIESGRDQRYMCNIGHDPCTGLSRTLFLKRTWDKPQDTKGPENVICIVMMFYETFYGRHTAQSQLHLG